MTSHLRHRTLLLGPIDFVTSVVVRTRRFSAVKETLINARPNSEKTVVICCVFNSEDAATFSFFRH